MSSIELPADLQGISNFECRASDFTVLVARLCSASRVPPLTLSECVRQVLRSAFMANNMKGGTGVLEAAMRNSLAGTLNSDWFVS